MKDKDVNLQIQLANPGAHTLPGKTVQSFSTGSNHVRLQFTDGSSLVIKAELGWEIDEAIPLLSKKLSYLTEVDL